MKNRTSFNRTRYALSFCLVVSSAFGCAALPPAKPVQDLKSIAGKWEGTVTTATATDAFVMTIQNHGSWEAGLRGGRFAGEIRVEGGKIHLISKSTGMGYTFTLYEGEGQRVLKGSSYDGHIAVELRPAR